MHAILIQLVAQETIFTSSHSQYTHVFIVSVIDAKLVLVRRLALLTEKEKAKELVTDELESLKKIYSELFVAYRKLHEHLPKTPDALAGHPVLGFTIEVKKLIVDVLKRLTALQDAKAGKPVVMEEVD